MTTNYPHQTAKIYQFPIGGRTAAGSLRKDTKSAAELLSQRVAHTACGEGWYHEAAIQDAKRTYEH
jgi:hypothetical protein